MRLTKTLLAAALAAFIAPASAAEKDEASLARDRAELKAANAELRELTRRIADLSMRLGEQSDHAYSFRYLTNPKRAMIGVVLDSSDKGVALAAVTPGGPAEKAGLRAGDRLLEINGKSVMQSRPSGHRGDEAMVAVTRDLLGAVEPDSKVRIAYERNGKRGAVDVVAERRESWDWPVLAGSFDAPVAMADFDHDIKVIVDGATRVAVDEATRAAVAEATRAATDARVAIAEARTAARHAQHDAASAMRDAQKEYRRVVMFRDGSTHDLRLAELNPELGRYFGTDRGVLVLDKGKDSLPELRRGDVITSIGGQMVESASGAMRAFGAHEAGSSVNIEVMRDRKRQVVVATVPERQDFVFPLPPPAPVAPLAPLPPSPPAVPRSPRAPKAAIPAPAPPAPPAAPSAPQPPDPPSPPRKLSAIVLGTLA